MIPECVLVLQIDNENRCYRAVKFISIHTAFILSEISTFDNWLRTEFGKSLCSRALRNNLSPGIYEVKCTTTENTEKYIPTEVIEGLSWEDSWYNYGYVTQYAVDTTRHVIRIEAKN